MQQLDRLVNQLTWWWFVLGTLSRRRLTPSVSSSGLSLFPSHSNVGHLSLGWMSGKNNLKTLAQKKRTNYGATLYPKIRIEWVSYSSTMCQKCHISTYGYFWEHHTSNSVDKNNIGLAERLLPTQWYMAPAYPDRLKLTRINAHVFILFEGLIKKPSF